MNSTFLRKRNENFIWRGLWKIICSLSNAEIPINCKIGNNVIFPHGLKGIVLHPTTVIEDNVTIFHQVTCGRGDGFGIAPLNKKSKFKGICLKKGCVICVGAKIICNDGLLVVGENTIVGANAVLTKSTGNNEIWVGVPAKCVKYRDRD